MKTWVCVFTLIGIVALSACQPSVPLTPALPRAAIDAVGATAWGELVDDPSGKPLRGVRVSLEPWKPCRAKPNVPWANKNQKPWKQHETLVCPKAIVNVTTRADGRFSFRAPAGHYLLVIGSDSPTDLTRPTIHDQIWLKRGSQHLLGPMPCPTIYPPGKIPASARCLPPIPQITFPTPERNGDYRLVTISHWEKPCIRAFDAYRAKWNLDPAVVDEWLTENNRAQIKEARLPNFRPWGNGNITYGTGAQGSGNSDCSTGVIELNVFDAGGRGSLDYSSDPRTHWIGTINIPLVIDKRQGIWLGNAEYPRDPRNWLDPLYSTWP